MGTQFDTKWPPPRAYCTQGLRFAIVFLYFDIYKFLAHLDTIVDGRYSTQNDFEKCFGKRCHAGRRQAMARVPLVVVLDTRDGTRPAPPGGGTRH
jgi:hypothetical protein